MKALFVFLLIAFLPSFAFSDGALSIVSEEYVHGDLRARRTFTFECGSDGLLDRIVLDSDRADGSSSSTVFILSRDRANLVACEGYSLELPPAGSASRAYAFNFPPDKGDRLVWRFDFQDASMLFSRPIDDDRFRSMHTTRYERLAGGGIEWIEYRERSPVSRGRILRTSESIYSYTSETFKYPRFGEAMFGEIRIDGDVLVVGLETRGDDQYRIVFRGWMGLAAMLRRDENLALLCSFARAVTAVPELAFFIAGVASARAESIGSLQVGRTRIKEPRS